MNKKITFIIFLFAALGYLEAMSTEEINATITAISKSQEDSELNTTDIISSSGYISLSLVQAFTVE